MARKRCRWHFHFAMVFPIPSLHIENQFEKESPLGLIGKAENIAACVLYPASDASKFVTGQDFIKDGGATC